jgi:hypothetical protein
MLRLRSIAAVLACLLVSAPLLAQELKNDPLTKEETEKIKMLGIEPNRRIGYIVDILNDRAKSIQDLTKRAPTPARDSLLDTKLQNFTAIMDELGDNMDEYGDRKADLRGSLKTLNDSTPRWMTILHSLAGTPAFDVSRKEAIESLEDLTDQGQRLLAEQEAYFKAHPKEKGQQRAEPN